LAGDEDTVPESRRAALVRARFRSDEPSRRAVDAGLTAPDPRERVLALRAAAAHGWLRVEQWLAALADPSAPVRLEGGALLAHHRDGAAGAGELDAALMDLLGDADALVVDAAAFALGERRVDAALGALLDVARDHADARCRECAVAALGVIGDDRAVPTVIAALSDKAPVRRRAVVALANFEGPEVDAALEAASEDRDWQVRAAVDQLERPDVDEH
jgi:HEAT repeat protein